VLLDLPQLPHFAAWILDVNQMLHSADSSAVDFVDSTKGRHYAGFGKISDSIQLPLFADTSDVEAMNSTHLLHSAGSGYVVQALDSTHDLHSADNSDGVVLVDEIQLLVLSLLDWKFVISAENCEM